MSVNIDLAIFDCDGVLVDSEALAVEVDKRVLADCGWHMDTDQILKRFLGRTTAYFRQEVEAFLGRPLPEDWEERYTPWYFEAFERELQPVPGVKEVLDTIDVPFCVASNGPHVKIRKTLGVTGLLSRFEGRIFSAEDVSSGKPAPDLFLRAAADMGVDPSRCAVIDDSPSGVAAGLAARMHVFGYAGGLTPASWLAATGVTVFEDMKQLPVLLNSR